MRGKRDVICVFSSLKITGDAFVTRSVRALWQERVVRGGIPEYHNTGRLAVIQFQPWIKLAESPTKRFKPCGRRAKIGLGSIACDRKIFRMDRNPILSRLGGINIVTKRNKRYRGYYYKNRSLLSLGLDRSIDHK